MCQRMDEGGNGKRFIKRCTSIANANLQRSIARTWAQIPPEIFHCIDRAAFLERLVKILKFLPVAYMIRLTGGWERLICCRAAGRKPSIRALPERGTSGERQQVRRKIHEEIIVAD